MNKPRFTALAATAVLSLAALASCGGASTPRVEPADIPYFSTRGPLTPLDIRGRAAYDGGHLPHAALMEDGVIPPELEGTPKGQPVIVYGGGAEGEEEERAAAALVEAGFEKVSILKGGMAAYEALDLPTHSKEDDERVREILEDFRNRRQPGAGDLTPNAERLKELRKIEKPEF